VGDQVVVSQEQKQATVFDCYENILGRVDEWDFTFDLEELGIQHHDLSSLDVPFSEEEVRATIKAMHMDKAPGLPEDFTSLVGVWLKATFWWPWTPFSEVMSSNSVF
jgi:hypothetical protein